MFILWKFDTNAIFFLQYQGEAQPQLKEHYNQHMVEAALKKTAPQNLAFYLAAMGGAAGPAGYPTWSPSSSQPAVAPRPPQPAGWSMPPGVSHYEYSANAFNASSANSTVHDLSFETKEEETVNSWGSLNEATVRDASL